MDPWGWEGGQERDKFVWRRGYMKGNDRSENLGYDVTGPKAGFGLGSEDHHLRGDSR